MADFQTRVDGLTGLTSGTHYTTAELTEYLKDGVIEVTTRVISLKPGEIESFQRTATSDSQGIGVGGSKIIGVMREANTDGSSDGSAAWRQCRKILASLQSRVVDNDSLHYASVYNPVYAIENNNTINVYPTPSANNAIKVFYVNEEPRDITNNASLIHSHSNIKYFPNDKVYLVVLYAGVKSLQNALAAKNVLIESDLTPVSLSLEIPETLSITDIIPVSPTLADNSVSFSETAPAFISPVMSTPDFADTNTWISTEEDPEMLQSRVAEIGAKIQEFSARVQEASAVFNKNNVEYQANLQIAMQDAQLSSQDDVQKLQKYTSELNSYQQSVTKQVTEYQAQLQKTTTLNSANVTNYQAQVAKANVRLQQHRTDYELMNSRLMKLQQEYDSAFLIMTGKIGPQPKTVQQSAERRQRRRR